jgi:hypothetical protein
VRAPVEDEVENETDVEENAPHRCFCSR